MSCLNSQIYAPLRAEASNRAATVSLFLFGLSRHRGLQHAAAAAVATLYTHTNTRTHTHLPQVHLSSHLRDSPSATLQSDSKWRPETTNLDMNCINKKSNTFLFFFLHLTCQTPELCKSQNVRICLDSILELEFELNCH